MWEARALRQTNYDSISTVVLDVDDNGAGDHCQVVLQDARVIRVSPAVAGSILQVQAGKVHIGVRSGSDMPRGDGPCGFFSEENFNLFVRIASRPPWRSIMIASVGWVIERRIRKWGQIGGKPDSRCELQWPRWFH